MVGGLAPGLYLECGPGTDGESEKEGAVVCQAESGRHCVAERDRVSPWPVGLKGLVLCGRNGIGFWPGRTVTDVV